MGFEEKSVEVRDVDSEHCIGCGILYPCSKAACSSWPGQGNECTKREFLQRKEDRLPSPRVWLANRYNNLYFSLESQSATFSGRVGRTSGSFENWGAKAINFSLTGADRRWIV